MVREKLKVTRNMKERIDKYVNGQLSHNEIERLWVELVKDRNLLDYLKNTANLKSVVDDGRKDHIK